MQRRENKCQMQKIYLCQAGRFFQFDCEFYYEPPVPTKACSYRDPKGDYVYCCCSMAQQKAGEEG